MTESMKEKFKELNMTRDEISRFAEAMKKEEFRKLLVDYAEEISDPKNREIYEREITALENERGSDVTFIHPEPGFCVKTSRRSGDTSMKCFVNICKNGHIDKPTSTRNTNSSAPNGLLWHIPHTCSQPRDDVDKSGHNTCVVYDVVFHPDAYRMGETNKRFQKLLIDSAFETIQTSFNVQLDAANFVILKHLAFKGRPTASIIRRPHSNASTSSSSRSASTNANPSPEETNQAVDSIIDQLKQSYFDRQDEAKREMPTSRQTVTPTQTKLDYTVPTYKIVHRGQVEVHDYANELEGGKRAVSSTRPKELVVTIDLPLCKSAAAVNLDIFETNFKLESSNPNYKLDLVFPFPVRSDEAKAKFDKSKRTLQVTLPVVPYVQHVVEEETKPVEMLTSDDSESSINLSSSSSSLTSTDDSHYEPESMHYELPQKVSARESSDYVTLVCTVANYKRGSIIVDFDSQSEFHVKCESASASGSYFQYFAMFVQVTQDNVPCEFIDINKPNDFFKVNHVSDDCFEVQIRKTENKSTDTATLMPKKKAIICANKKKSDQEGSQDQNWQVIEIERVTAAETTSSEQEPLPSQTKLSSMSKKEFILNFEKLAKSQDDDEDDVEETKMPLKSENAEFDKLNQVKETRKAFNETHDELDALIKENKIDEEPESLDDDNDESDQETEKKFLDAEIKEHHEDHEMLSSSSSSSTSAANFANGLASSYSGSSLSKLKSILKKPRSYSESESGSLYLYSHSLSNASTSSFVSNSASDENGETLTGSKKSVSFNKQVVRNVFKPGSTIVGMKKPGSKSHNKKNKNKRKRTVSDPSHDGVSGSFRTRSVSESSDDSSSQMTNSCESLPDETAIGKQAAQSPQQQQPAYPSLDKKRNKRNNRRKNGNKCIEPPETSESSSSRKKPQAPDKKPHFDVETMLEWNARNGLPSEPEAKKDASANIKFKNKFMDELDD